MILKVLIDDAPELLKVSDKVADISSIEKSFFKDMIDTMIAYDGIGLAAPQVGINKRIIVMLVKGFPIVMINPEIITKKGVTSSTEGCLSRPNRFVKKIRSKNVEASYFDINGEVKNIRLYGLEATCLQHEIDHLNGILIA